MAQLNPLVTVAVPCYNHEKFIHQCISSIINQTYKNIDLIVVDDGSMDNSPAILKELQVKHGFTLILQNNLGISKTLNNILNHHTRGQYFAVCASDDYWPAMKIDMQVNFMEANPFYPMCYGKTYYVNENSGRETKYDFHNLKLKGGYIFEDILLFKYHLPVNYLFRTLVFKELGGYDETLIAEDYYMNLKISSKYTVGYIDEFLSYYRMTDIPFKVDRFDAVADSHLKTIEMYKNHRLYRPARSMVYLRKFDLYSGFTKHKGKAISNFFRSLTLFYHRRFLLSCIKLILFWK